MSDFHFYEPRLGHGLPHDPFNALVAPRPIGWISTVDEAGTRNLAPYSFFNAFNYHPPIIGFSSIGRKDTVNNVAATGEFVWNFVSEALAAAMNASSAAAPHGVDEFALAGLATAPSRLLRPPRVAASPVAMECRLIEIVPLRGLDGAAVGSWLVLGEVVGVHIDRSLLKNGVFDTPAARPVLRTGGPGGYVRVGPDNAFDLRRPG